MAEDPAGRAAAYESRMARAMPGYGALHDLVAPLLVAVAGGVPGRALVAGAGTGAECRSLAAAGFAVVGVDPDPAMLAVAAGQLAAAGLGDRVELVQGEVAALPAGPPFDVATLILVLHFLPDDGAKAALLGGIAARLRPGGLLLLADLGREDVPDWHDRLDAAWAAFQRANGFDDEEIARGFRHVARAMHRIGPTRLAALLAAAGFGPPRPVLRALGLTAWVAARA